MSAPSGIFRGSGFPKGGIVPQKKPRGFSVSSHTRRGAHSGKTWVEKPGDVHLVFWMTSNLTSWIASLPQSCHGLLTVTR